MSIPKKRVYIKKVCIRCYEARGHAAFIKDHDLCRDCENELNLKIRVPIGRSPEMYKQVTSDNTTLLRTNQQLQQQLLDVQTQLQSALQDSKVTELETQTAQLISDMANMKLEHQRQLQDKDKKISLLQEGYDRRGQMLKQRN
jgi:DNA anti-recombination protein RmuC